MNLTLSNFVVFQKPGFFLLLLCTLFAFQRGNAQHCFPGYHFSADANTVAFDDQSTADGNITAYSWDFGDGHTSAEQNPTHTYTAPGTYNVCLTITAHDPACTETYCHHIVVHHPPAAVCHTAFAAHQTDPAQPTIVFTDQSTSDGTIGSWAWDFGDGSTSTQQNPTHTYAAPGTYQVCLFTTDADGVCTNHVCHQVVVHHPPAAVCHAAFVVHQSGTAQQTIDFTDHSTSDGTIGSWAWDFGDGHTSTEQNPAHTYAEPGTYQVCLVTTDADGVCTNHVCHQIVVHHPPAAVCHAAFAAHQTDPAQQTIDFTDQSTSDGTIGTWAWDFGDGHTSTEQNPTHSYAVPGTYLVCLIITDADGGCTNHLCHHVVVHHAASNECHAAFTVHTDASGFGIQFNNTSAGTSAHTTYNWEFGDGTTSTEENPHHTYTHPGHYTVCLFITDLTTGCSTHSCHTINVHHGGEHHYPHHAQDEPLAARRGGLNTERSTSPIDQVGIYPNPVVGAVQVVYHLQVTAKVKFELYSLTGGRVIELAENIQPAGEYTEVIQVGHLPPAVYVLKMTVDGTPRVHRILVQ